MCPRRPFGVLCRNVCDQMDKQKLDPPQASSGGSTPMTSWPPHRARCASETMACAAKRIFAPAFRSTLQLLEPFCSIYIQVRIFYRDRFSRIENADWKMDGILLAQKFAFGPAFRDCPPDGLLCLKTVNSLPWNSSHRSPNGRWRPPPP